MEQRGVSAVHAIVNEMNCEYRTLVPDNAGIDGEIQLVKATGEFSPLLLKCQVKSGASYVSSRTDDVLRVKLEKRHVELWAGMKIPVLVFFFDPQSEDVYWLSLHEYLRANPYLLKTLSETAVFTFRVRDDRFSSDSYEELVLAAEGKHDYGEPVYVDSRPAQLYTNWFEVTSMPSIVYRHRSSLLSKRGLPMNLLEQHAFIVKEGAVHSFADLSAVDPIQTADMKDVYLAELLNSALYVNAIRVGLVPVSRDRPRFAFPWRLVADPASNRYPFRSLRGRASKRTLVYYARDKVTGKRWMHSHAVEMCFVHTPRATYLELDPFMDVCIPGMGHREEERAMVTSLRQNTHNGNYLYLVHFWKEYLSRDSSEIRVATVTQPDGPYVIVSTSNDSVRTTYSFLNDSYVSGEV
jgi:hypothetical protein